MSGGGGELQATVRAFDEGSRGGEVVRDDGVVLPFAAAALDPAVRTLRPGQRVRARVVGDGVERLTLAGLPFT